MKVKNLKESGVPVRFGPISEPEKFEIDLLKEARRRLSINTVDFNELELEIGERLGEKPYSDTGRTKQGMPPTYLCEGSVWLNFLSSDDRYANISLVPHLDDTRHTRGENPHHNFWLYWTNFDGSIGSDKHIAGHMIPTGEPIVISIICGKEMRKGTINVDWKKHCKP